MTTTERAGRAGLSLAHSKSNHQLLAQLDEDLEPGPREKQCVFD